MSSNQTVNWLEVKLSHLPNISITSLCFFRIADQTVSAACLPSNVIPPNPNKQQTATCTLFLTNIVNDTATMYFLIKTTLYMSDASGAALYKGVANTSGDLLVDLTSRIRFDSLNVNDAFRGLFQIPSSNATHLLSNPEMYYFQIDTLNHTQGTFNTCYFPMYPIAFTPPKICTLTQIQQKKSDFDSKMLCAAMSHN